jgi:large conductance mechanosensitive channel
MLKGFRDFILRGNVVDLAVGVVIGAAFGAVVTSFTKDLLTPAIAAVAGKPDFSGIAITLNGSKLLVGSFLNALISFLLVAAAVYFAVIVPMNMVMSRIKKPAPEAPAEPATKTCTECTLEIPLAAKRCPHCTSLVRSTATSTH